MVWICYYGNTSLYIIQISGFVPNYKSLLGSLILKPVALGESVIVSVCILSCCGVRRHVDCHILLLLSYCNTHINTLDPLSSIRLSTSCTLTQTWSIRPSPRSGWTRRRRLHRHGSSAGRCWALTRSVVAGLACAQGHAEKGPLSVCGAS